MSQRKVYVFGTVQPGLNANFRKAGFCGSMNTPQETKAVLDMLDKERWAIPFDHIFYREGVDEANPPSDHRIEAEDVIGEFFGGVLTEKGDTVMIAELDPELDVVKKMVSDMKDYQAMVEKKLASGIPLDEIEKPPYGFSPQANIAFTDEDGVVDKDFKNISIVEHPEYSAEGSNIHAIGHNKEDLLRDLATRFVSKDGYVSPDFGSLLWSYRSDSRPPSSYTPKILIPVEDDDRDDPMETEAKGETLETNAEAPSQDPLVRETDNQNQTDDDPMPIDSSNIPERPAEAESGEQAVSVFSSHGKNDSSEATDVNSKPEASPSKITKTTTLTKPQASSVFSAPTSTPSMSQNEGTPMEGVEHKESIAHADDSSAPTNTNTNSPDPNTSSHTKTHTPTPAADESKDVEMRDSLPPVENRGQQRAKSAEAAEDFFKRAQQRNREMNTIKTDSERIIAEGDRLLSEMKNNPKLIDFPQIENLLQRFHSVGSKINDLDVSRKETPMSHTIATAKVYDVLSKWNEAATSAAKEKDMLDDLPSDLDAMMESPTVLQANKQVLRVFSKSLRNSASPTPSASSETSNRMNQRELEEKAEEIRKRKQQNRKRPREDDSYVKQPNTSLDEKKRKVNEGLVELPRPKQIGIFSSKMLDAAVRSVRYNHNRDFPRVNEKTAVTKDEAAIRQRWIRLANKLNTV